MDDLEKIRQSFYVEAEEIIENLEALLLDLENAPSDEELINAIFRNMHTLKGSSGVCELYELQNIAHQLEDLLDYIRSEKISPSVEMMDVLFEGLDTVKLVFSLVKEGEIVGEEQFASIVEKIRQFLPKKEEEAVEEVSISSDAGLDEAYLAGLDDETKGAIREELDKGGRLYQVSLKLGSDCLAQGIDPLLLLKSLAYDGRIFGTRTDASNIPPLGELDPVALSIGEVTFLFLAEIGKEEIEAVFEFASETGTIEIHHFTPTELKDTFDIDFDDFWLESSADAGEAEEEETGLPGPTVFFRETRTLLSQLEEGLKCLEKGSAAKEAIDDIYRYFHTIHGNARMFGYTEIASIAGFSETILDRIRESEAEMSPQTAVILREAAVEIGEFVDEREVKGIFEAEGLEKEGETVKRLGEILIEMGALSEEQLDAALKDKELPLGETLVKKGIVGEDKIEKALERQRSLSLSTHAAIRVDTARLDTLVNMVGELVITQTMLNHNPSIKTLKDNNLLKIMAQLDKITREVQENVMSIRMLPVKATFQKLIRVARELSKKAGKQVEIRVEGEETELDKTVIDEIGDPLVHIMRNAIDHGIESPEERKAAGKAETGQISLRAFHQGGNIVLELWDDGKGLDREAIIKKAMEKGLLSKSDGISDEEIFGLIFLPGFSTAKVVTDVSGRGVGMDVVKKNIEKLRGKVEIRSDMGVGSVFTIKLPLTLAVIDGMVVGVGKEKYILPTISIVESLRPEKTQISTVKGRGEMVHLRNNLFPLIRLHRLFGVEAVNENPWEAMVIQVEGEGKTACLLVDELIGQQQVVIKSLGESFKSINYVSGGAIMGDGRVGLILDMGGIIQAATC